MSEFDLKPFLPSLERFFASQQDAVAAYLFGSYARGRAWAQSDVDVPVLLNGRPGDETCFERRLEIMSGLMDILHINRCRCADFESGAASVVLRSSSGWRFALLS